MEDLKALEKQIATHKKSIADLLVKFQAKNSELYQLSKMTLDEYNTDIPKLRAEIESKKAEIITLDKLIADRKSQAEINLTAAKSQYEALGAKLEREYRAKHDELARQRDGFTLDKTRLADEKSAIEAEKASLVSRKSDLDKKERELLEAKNKLDMEMKSVFHKDQLVCERLSQAENLKNDLIRNHSELDALKEKVKADEKSAQDVLSRIHEAEKLLEEANTLSRQNAEKEAKINEQYVKLRVDMINTSNKVDDLQDKERSLNKREQNIRILEASFAKDGQ